jgi:hypothetical protein
MGQALTHGVYLPDEGERNCYSGLAANWQILDSSVGTIAEHTTALAGKAPLVHTHTKSDITDFPAYGTTAGTICEGNDSRLSDARTPVAHTHTKSDVTDLLNSNFIPSANNSYDLGSSEYNWNNVYCSAIYSPAIINSQNAASPSDSSVSSIVALRSIMTYSSGDPAAAARLNFRLLGTGEKSFYPHETNQYSFGLLSRQWSNSYIQHGYFTGIQQNDEYSSNTRTNLTLTANRDSAGVSGILVDSFRSNTTQGRASHALGFEIKENSTRYAGCRMYWSYDSNADKYNFALCPTKQGTNQPASFSLGLIGFYWDKINDCNPGALSLPVTALDNTYDISGDITDLTGGNNSITAARTGWIFVKSDNATEISIENTTTGMGASDHSAVAATLMVSIPVTSGETLNIIANCTSIDKAYLLPCQGNV